VGDAEVIFFLVPACTIMFVRMFRRNVLIELPFELNSITRNVLSYMVKEPRRISVERSIILRFKYDGM
jgi:hypothetical protein